ncbi:MAG TPA: EamA family transporter [Luteibacter sp.]|nr:EamA family transporter [Luteibacter sp.]
MSAAILPRSRNAAIAATLLAVGSMCSVQFGAALSTPVMAAHGSLSTTWLRLCWAALALAVVVRPPLHRYSRDRWLAAIILGAAMAGMTLCFFAALRHLPLGLAVAIDFLGPLGVAVIAMPRGRMLAWPALAAVGVLLLARHDSGWVADGRGLLLAFAAALGWGSYIVLMKKVGRLFDGLEGLSVSLLVAALVAAPFGLAESGGHLPIDQLVAAAGLAALIPLIPYVLEMIALRQLSTATFGILMSAEPAIGALAGFVVLNQAMTSSQCLGSVLVVGTSVGVALTTRK